MLYHVPALKLLLPLIIGIGLYYVGIVLPIAVLLTLGIIGVVLLILFFVLPINVRFKYMYISGIITTLLICVLAHALTIYQQYRNNNHHYSKQVQATQMLQAVVYTAPIFKTKSYKVEVALTKINNVPVEGKTYLYLTEVDSMPNLKPGNVITCYASSAIIKNAGNPGEYSYADFCKRKNITHTFFTKYSNVVVHANTVNNYNVFFENTKQATLKIIKKYVPNQQALGIAEALLIGDRTDIVEDVWQAYSKTGIVHIIAISGMHMGLIYSNFIFVLCFIPFFKKKKVYAVIIAVLAMWFFACITGLPASVLRAAVMFTFIGLATILRKPNYAFNMLALAATILLLFNTNLLVDIGFLLSFAAIAGILLFADKWYRKVYFKNYILNLGWKYFCATLAAQIFTLPFCIYYFHQVPLLFLITNLIAIPLTNAVLFIDIGILVFNKIPFIAYFLGGIDTAIILFLNKLIFFLSNFKYIAIRHVQISLGQMYVMLCALILLCYAVIQKHKYTLFGSLLLILIYTSISLYKNVQLAQQNRLVILQVPKQTAVEYYSGNTFYPLYTDSLAAIAYKFTVEPVRTYYQAHNYKQPYGISNTASTIYQVGPYHLLTVTNKIMAQNIDSTTVVLLTKNTNTDLNIFENTKPKVIVADASNSLWKIEQWKMQCASLNLRFHNTIADGAYVLNW